MKHVVHKWRQQGLPGDCRLSSADHLEEHRGGIRPQAFNFCFHLYGRFRDRPAGGDVRTKKCSFHLLSSHTDLKCAFRAGINNRSVEIFSFPPPVSSRCPRWCPPRTSVWSSIEANVEVKPTHRIIWHISLTPLIWFGFRSIYLIKDLGFSTKTHWILKNAILAHKAMHYHLLHTTFTSIRSVKILHLSFFSALAELISCSRCLQWHGQHVPLTSKPGL